MLIVFGVAVVGVLVEAFVPRAQRRPVQLVLTLGALAGGVRADHRGRRDRIAVRARQPGQRGRDGRGRVDGPTLFM